MKNRSVRELLERTCAEAEKEREPETAIACRALLKEVGAEEIEHKLLRDFSNAERLIDVVSTAPLGPALLLLYCGKLFLSGSERRKCSLGSPNCMRDQDFDLLVNAASRVRSLDLSPLHDPAVVDVLRRVCSTTYFIKEDVAVASRVFRKVIRLSKVCRSKLSRRLLKNLRRAYRRASFLHYRPTCASKLDFDVKLSLELEPGKLLRCLKTSGLLDKLVTSRPPKSVLPHCEAVILCIEHAGMWLNAPHLNVFHPLKITYGDLSSSNLSEQDHDSFIKFWNVRVPSALERNIRFLVFQLHAPRCFGAGGELHYLKPEEYEGSLGYLLSCLSDDLSEKQLQVFRTLQFPYRSKPEELDYQRAAMSEMYAEVCKSLMSREPPQYRHLYE